MHTTSSSTRPSARGLAAVALVALLVLSACGSSDDDSGASGGDDGSSSDSDSDDSNTDSNDDASTSDDSGGDGTGTLTMADGTVYEFEMNSCDTSDTDPEGFPLAVGYDLTGATSDGEFRIFLGRAGFDDETAVASGTLEGDFDEGGQNAGLLYDASNESLGLLVVDGGNVSGDLSFNAIGLTTPHGDETTATVEVSC